MIDKFREDVLSVLGAVPSGASLAVGGFGSSGRPDTLLDGLCDLDRRDLHLIVNNVGSDFTGVGRMLVEGRIRRLTASFPVLPEFYDEYFAGQVELELIPQGTLAERLRAGGSGIPAFYTPSGAGTTYPYGIQVNSQGVPWYVDFRGNRIARIEPRTMAITEIALPSADARPRRLAITADDAVWYSESGVRPNTLVRFDPASEKFQTWTIPSGGGVIRNMMAMRNGNLVLACSGVNRVALVEVRPKGSPQTH